VTENNPIEIVAALIRDASGQEPLVRSC